MKQSTQLQSALTTATVALALLFAAGAPRPAAAQPADAATLCTPDVMRLCSEFIPDRTRIVGCLSAKRSELSPGCRSVMVPAAGPAAAVGTKAAKTAHTAKKKKKKRRHSRHRT